MKRKPPKFSRRHAGVLLFLLEHPELSQKEAAKKLGYSEKWLSVIVSTRTFREEWSLTCGRLTDEVVRNLRRNYN